MDSFDAESRERFGNNVRVSMSFMDGSAIALRLKQRGQDIASNTADLLELLVRFDELEKHQQRQYVDQPLGRLFNAHSTCLFWKINSTG